MSVSVYAAAPFDHAKADIILRSSDSVDFRVFKLFLSLASPFFETLFEIPQPADASEDQEVRDGLVVVPVAENSNILGALLRFCYPCTLADDPKLEVLRDVVDILEAARKYSLEAIERKAYMAITNPQILEAQPLQCFALTRQAQLREETILSAKFTLMQPLIPAWFKEIELISAVDLLALFTYHKKCGDAVYALRADGSWITSYYQSEAACNWFLGRSPCRCRNSTTSYVIFGCHPAQWWEEFMDDIFEALRDKPCRATVQATVERTIRAIRSLDCSYCAGAVVAGMREFSDLLVGKIDEVISPIELDLNF